MGTFILVVITIAVLVGIVMFFYYFPLGLWIRTVAAGVPLSIGSLIRMRIIGVPAGLLVANLVRARKAGLSLTVDQLQSHILAGGNVDKVTLAMIAAQRAQIPLEWQRAAAIDLAGRDVLEALQTSVNPKVIETPLFQGVAQNGIQLNVKARITVRSNLDRYVGGAGEPTIVARVGEGVVSAVGAAIDHKEVLEYPGPHLEGRARERARRRDRVRDRLDRHRRRRRRQEHRRRPADLAGRSRPQDRASQGRRTPVRRAWRPSKR